MKKLLNPFVIILTTFVLITYFYANWRISNNLLQSLFLALPFLFVWLVPILYWVSDRDTEGKADHTFHIIGYLSMGFLNFFLISLLSLDLLLLLLKMTNAQTYFELLSGHQGKIVITLSLIAMLIGHSKAKFGPGIREVEIGFDNLPSELENLRIVQISDLHVGPTLGKSYVDKVVQKTLHLRPDLIVLTGDIVDGRLLEFSEDAYPLQELARDGKAYMVMGNHDYYSGPGSWIPYFEKMGIKMLMNSHEIININHCSLMIAGVTDPAANMFKMERPNALKALHSPSVKQEENISFKILLAHNPKLAPMGAEAGFDLQLSGHTHAGQFFPWTLVVKMVHKTHYWGISEESKMKVYVSAGTGTWGPPIRFGTEPELTLIKLKKIT